jgi:co-chaperonin GroES (HSP10)
MSTETIESVYQSLGHPLMSILDMTDEEMFERVDCFEELNEDIKEKKRWPRPRYEIGGKRYLAIQDDAHEKKGMIVIPDQSKKQVQATSGIIIQIGDGYDDPYDPNWQPPYLVGDRIAWGKYNHAEMEIDVFDAWWSEEELERITPDYRKVKFIALNTHQVYGKLL